MDRYVCTICGYVYDPAEGDPDNGVNPGTAWADVPEDWWVFNNRVHDVLPIARAMLEGETAYREGDYEAAWAALRWPAG